LAFCCVGVAAFCMGGSFGLAVGIGTLGGGSGTDILRLLIRLVLRLRVELAAYVAAHKPKQLTQPLFYTQRSEGFTANTLTHIVNGIYKGAGISGATSHSGRRTGLTNLAERGVGVRVLMALAGHSNMATTQRYIDLRPAMLKAAVELV